MTLEGKTRKEKLEILQDLVLDRYIEAVANNELKAMELAPIVTLLKNNGIIEKEEDSKLNEYKKLRESMKK